MASDSQETSPAQAARSAAAKARVSSAGTGVSRVAAVAVAHEPRSAKEMEALFGTRRSRSPIPVIVADASGIAAVAHERACGVLAAQRLRTAATAMAARWSAIPWMAPRNFATGQKDATAGAHHVHRRRRAPGRREEAAVLGDGRDLPALLRLNDVERSSQQRKPTCGSDTPAAPAELVRRSLTATPRDGMLRPCSARSTSPAPAIHPATTCFPP